MIIKYQDDKIEVNSLTIADKISLVPNDAKIQIEINITDDNLQEVNDTLKFVNKKAKELEEERKLKVAPLKSQIDDINESYKPKVEICNNIKNILIGEIYSFDKKKKEIEMAKKIAEIQNSNEVLNQRVTPVTPAPIKPAISERTVSTLKVESIKSIPAKFLKIKDDKMLEVIQALIKKNSFDFLQVDASKERDLIKLVESVGVENVSVIKTKVAAMGR